MAARYELYAYTTDDNGGVASSVDLHFATMPPANRVPAGYPAATLAELDDNVCVRTWYYEDRDWVASGEWSRQEADSNS